MTVARLTLREVWISYRLLAFVAALGTAGLVVPLAALWLPRLIDASRPPPSTTTALTWYGLALGVIAVLLAISAARTFARDRVRGTAAWLLATPIRRGAFYAGWLLAFAVVALSGMAISAATAWLTLGSFGGAPDPLTFTIASVAAFAFLLVAAAIGLVCGALLPRAPAAVVAGLLTAASVAAGVLLPTAARWLPSAGVVRLAPMATGVDGLNAAIQALGVAFAAIALLSALGTLAVERSDL